MTKSLLCSKVNTLTASPKLIFLTYNSINEKVDHFTALDQF